MLDPDKRAMTVATPERALWLSKHVFVHEPELRSWLNRRQVAGLDVDDVIQESYAILAGLQGVGLARDAPGHGIAATDARFLSQVKSTEGHVVVRFAADGRYRIYVTDSRDEADTVMFAGDFRSSKRLEV
jgi:hypothetical protein